MRKKGIDLGFQALGIIEKAYGKIYTKGYQSDQIEEMHDIIYTQKKGLESTLYECEEEGWPVQDDTFIEEYLMAVSIESAIEALRRIGQIKWIYG